VKIHDRPGQLDRRARIELMIEIYRRAKQRRLVRVGVKIWRRTAIDQQLARLDAPPQRIH
jgi:hypothetical protein